MAIEKPSELAYRAPLSLERESIGRLQSLLLLETNDNPAREGEIQRNGNNIYYYDGTTATRLNWLTAITTLLSGTFAIDSTGVKTVTTAHGLSVTPAIQDVQLTVSEDSNVDDWAYGYVKVESVDGTNVVAKVNVTTASATGGATAKLNILVVTGV